MENKFNKDFEDFAWSEMQKLLDRDLPVAEKKRRRGFIFWLFIMVGLVAFISGSAFIYKKLTINNSNSTKSDLVINSNSIKSDLSINSNSIKSDLSINSNSIKSDLSINSNSINNDLAINSNSIKSDLVINSNSDKSDLVINSNSIQSDLSINSNSIQSDLSINSNSINSDLVINSKLNTAFNPSINTKETPQYFNEKVVNYEDATQGKLIPVELIAELNINQPQLIKQDSLKDISKNQLDNGQKITTRLRYVAFSYPRKARFGIETGAHTEGYKQLDGWQLGVVMNKQFRWNWSFSAGLNYRKTVMNSDSLTYYQTRELSGYNNQTATTNAVFPANKLILNQLNYIELPISLNYHINKKWSIATGIKTAYLVNANVNTLSDSTLFFLNTSTKDMSGFVLKAGSTDIKLLGLKRWDFAAIGGIYFKPTNKIQLSLRYDYGFRNSLNRPNWSAYNRFLGLNAAYYFR